MPPGSFGRRENVVIPLPTEEESSLQDRLYADFMLTLLHIRVNTSAVKDLHDE